MQKFPKPFEKYNDYDGKQPDPIIKLGMASGTFGNPTNEEDEAGNMSTYLTQNVRTVVDNNANILNINFIWC